MNLFIDDWSRKLFKLYLEDKVEDGIKLILEQWNKSAESWFPRLKRTERDTEEIKKSSELVTTMRNTQSMVSHLLQICTAAIAYAPNNSSDLSRNYSNRSVALCKARMYEDSLQDIDRALANCPDHKKAKLYTRKAKDLSALDAERSAIEEAIAEARHWMVKTNVDENVIDTKLKEITEPRSNTEPFEKPDNSIVMSDITDANETLIGASNAITLKYSEEYGRHIVATQDIRAGETLVRHKPYSLILPLTTYTHCWNCSRRTWAGIPCTHCPNVVYCNDNCRNEAWNNYHDVECLIIAYLTSSNPDVYELMSLRLVIRALKEAGSIELLKEKLNLLDSMPDLLQQGFTDDILDNNTYAGIYTLSSGISFKTDHKLHAKRLTMCTLILFTWASTSDIFGKTIKTMDELINNESAMFIGQLFMKNIQICDRNAHQVRLRDGKDYLDAALMISCLSSCFNHSCDSNAFFLHSGDTVIINSVQPIQKFEQVFIAYECYYEKVNKPFRQQYLAKRYSFNCDCLACLGDWTYHSEEQSILEKSLSNEKLFILREILTGYVKKLENKSLNEIKQVLSSDISCISILIELLNDTCKHGVYPCAEILAYKGLLKMNYEANSY